MIDVDQDMGRDSGCSSFGLREIDISKYKSRSSSNYNDQHHQRLEKDLLTGIIDLLPDPCSTGETDHRTE
jgi:hypothetical protein